MTKHTPLEQALYAWIKSATDRTTIAEVLFTDQNAPKITGSFAIISMDEFNSDGRPEIRYGKPDPVTLELPEYQIYRATGRITLRVFSKSSTLQLAEEVKTRLWGSRSTDQAYGTGIGMGTIGATIDRTYLEEAGYNQRADFTIDLHYATIYEDIIASIGHVPIFGESTEGLPIMDETIDEP